MNLILHIGIFKTGSTYIQSQLWNNRNILIKEGILFVPEMYNFCKNLSLLTPAKENLLDAGWLAFHRLANTSKVNGKNVKTILVSCESLCYLKDPDIMIDQLHYILNDFKNIKIILCVRRQDEYLESSYVQNVKKGKEKHSFQEKLNALERDIFLWDILSNKWNYSFDLVVFPYEVYKKENIAKVFFNMFADIKPDIKPMHINPSLTKKGVEKILKGNEQLNLKDINNDHIKPIGERQKFFTHEQRLELLNYYSDSNKCLFVNHLANYNYLLNYYLGVE